MTKVIPRLQAFSSAIRRTFVQYFTRLQLTACLCGPSATAGLFVSVTSYLSILENAGNVKNGRELGKCCDIYQIYLEKVGKVSEKSLEKMVNLELEAKSQVGVGSDRSI